MKTQIFEFHVFFLLLQRNPHLTIFSLLRFVRLCPSLTDFVLLCLHWSPNFSGGFRFFPGGVLIWFSYPVDWSDRYIGPKHIKFASTYVLLCGISKKLMWMNGWVALTCEKGKCEFSDTTITPREHTKAKLMKLSMKSLFCSPPHRHPPAPQTHRYISQKCLFSAVR